VITEGVNSYCTLAFANAFHETQRHNSDWFTEYVQEDIAAALITVTRYIDYYEYKGYPVVGTQPLKWPRQQAYYNGGLIDSTAVPIHIKYATAQIALDYLRNGIGPKANADTSGSSIDGAISSIKAGSVEIKYAGAGATVTDTSGDISFLSPEGFRLLRPFMGSNFNSHRMVRV